MTRLLASASEAGHTIRNENTNRIILYLEDIKLFTAVDHERDRAIVDERNLHIRPKLSGLDLKILLPQLFNKTTIKTLLFAVRRLYRKMAGGL